MIRAYEAKRKSIINSEGKKYLDKLETYINKAIKEGLRSARMPFNLTASSDYEYQKENQEIGDAIIEELTSLGYTVQLEYATPIPAGCPSDQWNFDNGHITVNW